MKQYIYGTVRLLKKLWRRRNEFVLLAKGWIFQPKLDPTKDNAGLIVSLTTYNKRIHKVHLTIESILQQKLPPERVILWLYEGEIAELSGYLKFQQKRGLEIRFVDENLKSFKKLIYAYEEFPDKAIVTVDDDIIYPQDMLSQMVKQWKSNITSIVCYRAKQLQLESSMALKPYKFLPYSEKLVEPSYQLLPIGCSGILYPPSSLHPLVLNKSVATSLCDNADDIWFKVMALLKRTKAVMVLPKSIHFPLIDSTQDDSLHKSNNVENLEDNESKNDKALKRTIDYVNQEFDDNLYKLLVIKDES